MLDDKIREAIDQSIGGIAEVFPLLWYKLYKKCKEEGFTDQQAFDLVKTWVFVQDSDNTKSM